jgi:hypothetical protein
MNVLTQAKYDLAESLDDAGIKAEYYIPPRITPPLAIISPDAVYVRQGDTFSSFEVGLEITLVAQTASNPKATESLDDALVLAIGAIPATWTIQSVEQPFALNTGNAEYLATKISVTGQITI